MEFVGGFKQEQRIGKAYLYIDSQLVNQELYKAFVRKANTVTVVSAEALRYRLKELNILKSFSYVGGYNKKGAITSDCTLSLSAEREALSLELS